MSNTSVESNIRCPEMVATFMLSASVPIEFQRWSILHRLFLSKRDRFHALLNHPGADHAVPKNDKHLEYVHYAEYCLNMMTSTKDQDARAINREMAAEWLNLADAVLHPLKRMN
jgi:hypothetical protein